jgi:hypothetical protein
MFEEPIQTNRTIAPCLIVPTPARGIHNSSHTKYLDISYMTEFYIKKRSTCNYRHSDKIDTQTTQSFAHNCIPSSYPIMICICPPPSPKSNLPKTSSQKHPPPPPNNFQYILSRDQPTKNIISLSNSKRSSSHVTDALPRQNDVTLMPPGGADNIPDRNLPCPLLPQQQHGFLSDYLFFLMCSQGLSGFHHS